MSNLSPAERIQSKIAASAMKAWVGRHATNIADTVSKMTKLTDDDKLALSAMELKRAEAGGRAYVRMSAQEIEAYKAKAKSSGFHTKFWSDPAKSGDLVKQIAGEARDPRLYSNIKGMMTGKSREERVAAHAAYAAHGGSDGTVFGAMRAGIKKTAGELRELMSAKMRARRLRQAAMQKSAEDAARIDTNKDGKPTPASVSIHYKKRFFGPGMKQTGKTVTVYGGVAPKIANESVKTAVSYETASKVFKRRLQQANDAHGTSGVATANKKLSRMGDLLHAKAYREGRLKVDKSTLSTMATPTVKTTTKTTNGNGKVKGISLGNIMIGINAAGAAAALGAYLHKKNKDAKKTAEMNPHLSHGLELGGLGVLAAHPVATLRDPKASKKDKHIAKLETAGLSVLAVPALHHFGARALKAMRKAAADQVNDDEQGLKSMALMNALRRRPRGALIAGDVNARNGTAVEAMQKAMRK